MSAGRDCFAIATPHQTESHYSVYLSLFGRDLKAGETVRARARLLVTAEFAEDKVVAAERALASAERP
jgi:hypothetical protein